MEGSDMSEYTPLDHEIRAAAIQGRAGLVWGRNPGITAQEYDRWLEAHDREVTEAAVLVSVKPSREEVGKALSSEFGPFLVPYSPERFWRNSADRIIALFPDKTEAEVREQVAAEIEAAREEFSEAQLREIGHLPPVQSGIVAGYTYAARIAREGGQRS